MNTQEKAAEVKRQMLTSKQAYEIKSQRAGSVLAEYSTYNPVLQQDCLSTIKLVCRIRCTEDALKTEKQGTETHWIEYGWVDGSHPSMEEHWDSEEQAAENAREYAAAHDTGAKYVNPAPLQQKGLVER